MCGAVDFCKTTFKTLPEGEAAVELEAHVHLHEVVVRAHLQSTIIINAVVDDFISDKVQSMSFCKSQFPHISVNLFFVSVIVKDKRI
jgi:hypothetical protein